MAYKISPNCVPVSAFAGATNPLTVADTVATSLGLPLYIDFNITLTTNTILTSSKTPLPAGGLITRGTHTLTWTNASAPNSSMQMFDAAGTGLVTWGTQGGSINASLYGVVGDGVTDNSIPLQAAHDSVAAWSKGGELIIPQGLVICNSRIVFSCTAGTAFGNGKGFTLRGYGGNYGSELRTGAVSTDGFLFGNTSGISSPGVTIKDILFSSSATASSGSGETNIVNLNNCTDARLYNMSTWGGFNTAVYIGDAQGVRWDGGRIVGFTDISGNYLTSTGLKISTSTSAHAGQDCTFLNLTIREIRNTSHTGTAVNFVLGGGSEHNLYTTEIENCDISCNVDQNEISVQSCQWESRGVYWTSTAGGGNTGTGTVTFGTFGTGSWTNGTVALQQGQGTAGSPGYTITATSSGPTATFTVTDPNGNSLTGGTTGTQYTAQVVFTLGGSPVSGDTWILLGSSDILCRVGHAATTISAARFIDNRMSMTGVTNSVYFNFETYKAVQCNENFFNLPLGFVVFASANNSGNARNEIIGNKFLDPILNISWDPSLVDGKWKVDRNITASTTPDRIILTANSTTPYITNAAVCSTLNTNPTTITQFKGGYAGKSFELIINDGTSGTASNTTLTHGTAIFLLTGKTTTYQNGSILRFQAGVGSASGSSPVFHEVPGSSATSQKYGTNVLADVSKTVTPGTDLQYQVFNTALTADRTVTPVTTNAVDGITEFDITYTATAAASGHNLIIKNAAGTTLKTLSAAGTAKIIFSSTLTDFYLAST